MKLSYSPRVLTKVGSKVAYLKKVVFVSVCRFDCSYLFLKYPKTREKQGQNARKKLVTTE
jgi:hypothetical protein